MEFGGSTMAKTMTEAETKTKAETKNSLLYVDINSGFLALVGNIKSYTGGVLLNKKLVS